ncbi:hypothetical protein WME76_17950 [Sorangium sp. So ce119]|uniref:hypothetical protein n=1 Tax=Sorangium sp. So ce119 TaxID=3133279 RepID=UPI003F624C5D
MRNTAAAPGSAPRDGGGAVVPIARNAPEPLGLAALRIARLASDKDGRDDVPSIHLQTGAGEVEASVDPAVHPVVLRTAFERGERVIAQREGGAWVVLGVLRTGPTPGVDPGDEYLIRARRVSIVADHEFAVVSGAASLVLRAFGYVETIAQDITARATNVHKVIGRVIRLN